MVDASLRGLTSGLDPESDFLDDEEMQGRQGENKHVYRAVPEDYRFAASNDDVLARLPKMTKTVRMVLLEDRGSAAGTEIAAGALQDHKRAVILGERTVGRTTIQEIFPLPGNTGAIKLTTGRWITPRGRSFASTGAAPDVIVAGVARFSDDAEGRDAGERRVQCPKTYDAVPRPDGRCVAWMVTGRESSALAKQLVDEAHERVACSQRWLNFDSSNCNLTSDWDSKANPAGRNGLKHCPNQDFFTQATQ